jgi:hypothetical protein
MVTNRSRARGSILVIPEEAQMSRIIPFQSSMFRGLESSVVGELVGGSVCIPTQAT